MRFLYVRLKLDNNKLIRKDEDNSFYEDILEQIHKVEFQNASWLQHKLHKQFIIKELYNRKLIKQLKARKRGEYVGGSRGREQSPWGKLCHIMSLAMIM